MTAGAEWVPLVRLVARMTRRRHRSKRSLQHAHELLRLIAHEHGLSEEWADAVLLLFLDRDVD